MKSPLLRILRQAVVLAALVALAVCARAVTISKSSTSPKPGEKKIRSARAGSKKAAASRTARRRRWQRYAVKSYGDPTAGDVTEGEDAVVREAAVHALGNLNGSVVVVAPQTGRILTIVNQNLAFSEGFQPCSTIKLAIAVAALNEGLITRDTLLRVSRRQWMNLTEAIAHSNNRFFEILGEQLGFEKVATYARMLGFGELAGYQIEREHPGAFPTHPPTRGGVARLSSFGQDVQVTPLQLGALVSAFANGGTLYYLQYPRTPQEMAEFQPRAKRRLEINGLLPELRSGMLATTLYGTARAIYDPDEPVLGKTGTCSAEGARLGWFASYADEVRPKLAVVVLLRGGRVMYGPHAAEIAGRIYRELYQRNYVVSVSKNASSQNDLSLGNAPVSLHGTGNCCGIETPPSRADR